MLQPGGEPARPVCGTGARTVPPHPESRPCLALGSGPRARSVTGLGAPNAPSPKGQTVGGRVTAPTRGIKGPVLSLASFWILSGHSPLTLQFAHLHPSVATASRRLEQVACGAAGAVTASGRESPRPTRSGAAARPSWDTQESRPGASLNSWVAVSGALGLVTRRAQATRPPVPPLTDASEGLCGPGVGRGLMASLDASRATRKPDGRRDPVGRGCRRGRGRGQSEPHLGLRICHGPHCWAFKSASAEAGARPLEGADQAAVDR